MTRRCNVRSQIGVVLFVTLVSGVLLPSQASAQKLPPRQLGDVIASEAAEAAAKPIGVGQTLPLPGPGQDGLLDGLLKGALVGVAVAAILDRGLGNDAEFGPGEWAQVIAIGAFYGGVRDALNSIQSPRGRPGIRPPAAGVRVRIRF
jgi:hypothetical protein